MLEILLEQEDHKFDTVIFPLCQNNSIPIIII